jgi:hypothetical protein
MANELDMLLASAPPRDAADFAAFEATFLGRKPDCLSTADLIRLALGQAEPGAARNGRAHLTTCDSCRAIHDAYKQGLEEEEPPITTAGSLLDEFSAKGERMTGLLPTSPPASPHPSSPAASGSQSISLTNVGAMLLSGRWEEALELLRPCLAEFLDAVGLDPARSEDFFQFIRRRLASGPGLPPSGLPGWLEDFARTELSLRALPRRLEPHECEAVRNRCALLALRESSGEPEATRKFLTFALSQGVRSCEQLELIRLKTLSPEVSISDVECRDLIKRGRKQSKRFTPLFPAMTN